MSFLSISFPRSSSYCSDSSDRSRSPCSDEPFWLDGAEDVDSVELGNYAFSATEIKSAQKLMDENREKEAIEELFNLLHQRTFHLRSRTYCRFNKCKYGSDRKYDFKLHLLKVHFKFLRREDYLPPVQRRISFLKTVPLKDRIRRYSGSLRESQGEKIAFSTLLQDQIETLLKNSFSSEKIDDSPFFEGRNDFRENGISSMAFCSLSELFHRHLQDPMRSL